MTKFQIHFFGDPSFAEYRKARWATMPKSVWYLPAIIWITVVCVWISPALILLAVIFVILFGRLRVALKLLREQLPSNVPVLVLAAVAPVSAEFSIRKSWRKHERAHDTIHGSVTLSGIQYTSGTVDGDFPWAKLMSYHRTGALILIKTDCNQCLWFPTRFFKCTEEWQQVCELIHDNIANTKNP